MPLQVVDDPPDRPQWIRETIRLVAGRLERERAELLARVARASGDDLRRGSDDDWGLGQIAVHLLVVERGVLQITSRLAKGEAAVGPTGQPRPAADEVTREGIQALAGKAALALARFQRDFPAAPDMATTARHPFYGDLNCFGWLLILPFHFAAHLAAQEEGRPSAL